MDKFTELIAHYGMTALLEHIHAMIALVDGDGKVVSWNRAFESYRKAFPQADRIDDFFPVKEQDHIQKKIDAKIQERWTMAFSLDESDENMNCDCLLTPFPDGRALLIVERFETNSTLQHTVDWLNQQVIRYQNESEEAKKIARNKQTEVNGIVAQANEMSYIDPLTFLPNRRLIVRELQDEILHAESANREFSISVVDVDNFKKVNDTYGHITGDHVLRHVAYQLRDHIRHPDVAGRYGGEEFLVLLPNTDVNSASEQAARLCKQVREMAVQVKKHTLNVTVSIGVAQYKKGVDTWETLLSRADKAMYEAKKKGRDRWVAAD